MEKQIVFTKGAPEPVGPYSQAVKAQGLLFVSGQLPINPVTGEIVGDSFESQVKTVLDNLRAVLEAGGSRLDRVCKVTIYLTDMKKFGEMNTIYDTYFHDSRPARACVEVSGLPRGVSVEIEAVALCD